MLDDLPMRADNNNESPAQTGELHKIHRDASERARQYYVVNSNPVFVPPQKFVESFQVEELDDALAKAKDNVEALRQEIGQVALSERQRKKAHWFIKKLLRTLQGVDVFRSDILVKQIGNRTRVKSHRRNVINQALRAVAMMHDILTGVLPKSCLTSLSDQMDVTTYGKKRYGEYAGQELPDDDLRGKKKSISRISRGVKNLVQWGIVEVIYDHDPGTGKYVPSIIKVTERFYSLLMMEASDIQQAKFDKLRQGIQRGVYPDDLQPDELEPYINKKIEEMQAERRKFAQLRRQRKWLTRMSKQDVHDAARRDVMQMYTDDELRAMSDERFQALIRDRSLELHALRRDCTRVDEFHLEIQFGPPPNIQH